ncbi:pilus assembly protein N-terminal domain-containing protein [Caenibius sp. WL]|nr:pilus assembly protein N-terminal domain-containing protein [Caenibius sp. WL]QZP08720.1 pilus assembly protein N-terminal domain-containing protein [Caenibius sp. WL]
MKALIATCLLSCTAPLVLAPATAAAQERQQQTLQVNERRTLSYPRAIGRVEVDRQNVIGVSAPTARSLRITGTGQGMATLTVYATDGALMGEAQIRVMPTGFAGGGAGFAGAGEKVVAVDVQFAAVSSSTLKALGFNFSKLSGDLQGAVVSPSTLNSASFGSGGLTLDTSAPIQSAFNLFLSAPKRGIGAVLSALSSNGLSQLLAQPTLLVRSGETAEFLAGGEFPVPVPSGNGTGGNTISIDYKEFGVKLKVTPVVLSRDNIILRLAPEVSELDYGNGVQLQGYVVPGIRRRSAETTVELGSGQSFVIAGLNYSMSSVTKDKLPLLGDIPIIGAFFKRQQNQKERQELIIVATPRLVDPLHPDDVPPLPGANADIVPTFGEMVVGNDSVKQSDEALFGVVRR